MRGGTRLARLILPGAIGLAALLGLAASPTAAMYRPSDYPNGYAGYHDYGEMVADIDSEVAAHPNIVYKFSIGKSYQGRQIWAVKISDNVGVDQNEPEVLFEGEQHAREHLAGEEGLHLMHLFADNYGASTALGQRVTTLVNSREIFIIPDMNPDGSEYDLSNSTGFMNWRKNRQPIPGSTKIGVDLNRNWGYKWGCCGGSSANPGSIEYRGPKPWSAPEVRALRNFVLSRVKNGRQQITEAISWHTFNEQIMWPYGYTKTDLPRTMTADDLAAFKQIGTNMASRNGYTAQQLSDIYILDGDTTDWLYGAQRIFAFTIEMYPTDSVPEPRGFYPTDSVINAQTTRNDDAVLYFVAQAACPYLAANPNTTDCGPLYDDFETSRGWKVNAAGTDTATRGKFQRAIPQKTASGGVKQLAYGHSGQYALVTGPAARSSAAANDVDGGTTSVTSPIVKLGSDSSGGWTLSFAYMFAHDATSSTDDYFRVLVNGQQVFIDRGAAANRNAAWTKQSLNLDAFAGQNVSVTFEAADNASDSLVEAAVDDVRLYQGS